MCHLLSNFKTTMDTTIQFPSTSLDSSSAEGAARSSAREQVAYLHFLSTILEQPIESLLEGAAERSDQAVAA